MTSWTGYSRASRLENAIDGLPQHLIDSAAATATLNLAGLRRVYGLGKMRRRSIRWFQRRRS